MSYYLVSATPRRDLLDDLHDRLERGEFRTMRPFGKALSMSLENARRTGDGGAIWEEEDYCRPPLAQERAAVLDRYFDGLGVEQVELGAGWERIKELPSLFPDLSIQKR